MWDLNLTELFQKGGVVMWPLLACSVLGLTVILERTLVVLWNSARFQALADRLERWVQAGKIDEAKQQLAHARGSVPQVALAYLRHLDSPAELREEVVAREASRRLTHLENRLNWLALLAQVTPLLGLFGTVLGLMTTFYQIDVKGSGVQTADLAVGIWQKLLNTAFGMVIAVPCLIAYYWLDRRVNIIGLQMEWLTSYLNEWLHVSGASSPNAPSENGAAITGKSPVPASPERAS
jgi:biopolymer transport protein ExbB